MKRNRKPFSRGIPSSTGTKPNRMHDKSAVNCDEHIPWFLRNMIVNFPPMERLIDYVIDRLQDQDRFFLARQLESCKKEKTEQSLALFGLDAQNPDIDLFFEDLPERVNPSRLNHFLNELAMNAMPVESYRSIMLSLLPKAFGAYSDTFTIHPRLKKLGRMLSLSKQELVYITFAYCLSHDDDFSRLCNWEESARMLRDAALMLGMDSTNLRKMICDDSPLIRYGIIEVDTNRKALRLDLDECVDDYLSGYANTPYSADLQPLTGARFDINSFPVSNEERTMLVSLLRSKENHHILFYGLPGTGKTEFMRSLIQESGREAKLLRFNESMKNSQGRIFSLSTVSRMLAPSKSILVIDECDSILNTGNGDLSLFGKSMSSSEQLGKEWINLFMDEAKLTTIWITNDISGIHESVKRRFNTSVVFEATPLEHRKRIWLALAREYSLAEFAADPRAIRLINGYLPSPANMEAALKLIKNLPEDDLFMQLELAFNAQRTLRQGRVSRPKLEELTDRYDPMAVNTSVPAVELLEAIHQSYSSQKNCCLLFHGSPGTGKTELAKYLSKECGRNLLVKRASDLLNPFVGLTEKLIAEMFREAERDGAILLLDEADSMLRERSTARHSWELTQTNELLTQIENFKGVLIACTNLIDIMDKAVIRRFSWKVHFRPLTASQRVVLFKKWFPIAVLDELATTDLAAITVLSPGDYKAVAGRLSQQRSSETVYIVRQLIEEAGYRDQQSETRQKIGFEV